MSEGWSCSLNRLSSARSLEVCVSQRGVAWRGAGWPKLCSDAATPQLSFRIGARAQATLGPQHSSHAPLSAEPRLHFFRPDFIVLGRQFRHFQIAMHVRSQRVGIAKLPDILAEEAAGARDGERREASNFIGGRRPARCCALDTRLQRSQQGPAGSPAGSPARGARAEARFHCSCSALAVYGRGGLARARRWLSVARLLEFLPAFPAVVAARHHHLLATISTLPSVTLTRHHLPQTSSHLLASRLLLHWHHSIRHSALHKKRLSQSVLRADRCPRSFLRLVSRSIGHNSAFASIIHPTKKAVTATPDCVAPRHALICIRSESCSRSE